MLRLPQSPRIALADRSPLQALLLTLAIALPCTTGCRGANWAAGSSLIVQPARVAAALGEAPGTEAFDRSAVPVIDPPRSVRPCCAFGMDLKARIGRMRLPGYSIGNVTDIPELGRHEYDNGAMTVQSSGRLNVEKNGLVYTCRGGFVDISHVRDYADMVYFLSLRLLRDLPDATTIEFAGDGAIRRIRVGPLPPGPIAEKGRFRVATTIATWIAFQLSVWHEIASWYGYETIAGYSERVSAFSLEDVYSNLVGMRIGAAVVVDHGLRSRDDFNHMMDAWIVETLRFLGAVPRPLGRLAMQSVDGRWWDSKLALPDNRLVTHRDVDITPPVHPWRIDDAVGADHVPAPLRLACPARSEAIPLALVDHIGPLSIAAVTSIEWEPGDWAKASFPFPDPGRRTVRADELAAIVRTIRARMEEELGPGFDRPAAPRH